MKMPLLLWVALFAVTSAQAQVFRPHVRPAREGGSGGQVHRHSPSVAVGYRGGHGQFGHRSYGSGTYRSLRIGYYPAYDYGYYPYTGYGYYPYANYGYGTGYYSPVYQGSGSAAANGLWLGALAGGIIGHNSGDFRHNGWRGAAWGAGLGWLLGSVVDANRRAVAYETPVNVQAAPAVQTYAAPAAQTQPVTIINNYYNTPATPMSAANALFGRN